MHSCNKAIAHYKITVIGKVQGVFYRQSTLEKGLELGLQGTVQNVGNNQVKIEAEGALPSLQALVQWCHSGPPAAVVQQVLFETGSLENFVGFKILR